MLSILFQNMVKNNPKSKLMVKNILIAFFLFFLLSTNIEVIAQDFPAWYLVNFTDKDNSPYDLGTPSEFISQKAISRRSAQGIEFDSTDLPVNPNYIDSLEQLNLLVYHTSKWLNAALVKVDTITQISALNSISIIDSIAYMAPFIEGKSQTQTKRESSPSKANTSPEEIKLSNFNATKNRIDMIELGPLLDNNYNGKGIHIAVLDNGFINVNKMAAFSHLFDRKAIIMTRNFTNNGYHIYNSGSHGTAVLSTMAGFVYGEFVGSAIGANYYLFKTEDNRYEYPIEEANWLFAAEVADSAGVDIITSSLVYSTFDDPSLDYTLEQLDGKTSLVSKAASLAIKKGIIVFNSAGNMGGGAWQKIAFPADVDGLYSIGAVDKDEKLASFSSTGYSADGRIKPDFVAEGEGTPIIGPNEMIVKANGTSFSNPFMAGAMATFLQANPQIKHSDIYSSIVESSSNYYSPDSLIGYGIPNFYLASVLLKNKTTIDESSKDLFTILPNPFQDKLHILYTSIDSQLIDIYIYDTKGIVLYKNINILCHKGNNLIEIESIDIMSAGTYILQISNSEGLISKKIIKER